MGDRMSVLKWRLFVGFLLLGLVLAACTGAPATVDQAPDANGEVPDVVQVPEVEAPDASEPDQDEALPRQELEATDPTSVNLVSGKPTLVEFFAFW